MWQDRGLYVAGARGPPTLGAEQRGIHHGPPYTEKKLRVPALVYVYA